MNGLVAVVAGGSAVVVVGLLGLVARRPPRRVPRDADGRSAPRRRPARTVVVLAGALVAGAAAAALGPLVVAMAGGFVVAVHRQRHRSALATHRRMVDAAMPDAVELLVLCIEAGCSPRQALVELAARAPPAVRPSFAEVERVLHRGQSLADALGVLASSTSPLGRAIASAIANAERSGLPLTPALDRLATDARDTRRRLAEADARRLPVRLTFPLVLCTLPSFVLLAIAPAVLGALSTLRGDNP